MKNYLKNNHNHIIKLTNVNIGVKRECHGDCDLMCL